MVYNCTLMYVQVAFEKILKIYNFTVFKFDLSVDIWIMCFLTNNVYSMDTYLHRYLCIYTNERNDKSVIYGMSFVPKLNNYRYVKN